MFMHGHPAALVGRFPFCDFLRFCADVLWCVQNVWNELEKVDGLDDLLL